MTDEEISILLLKWAERHGGIITDEDADRIAAILGEHFVGIEEARLEDAMRVLGLKEVM